MTVHDILELFTSAHPWGRMHSLCIYPNGKASAVFPMSVQRFDSLEELVACAEVIKEKMLGPTEDLPPPEPEKPVLVQGLVGDGFTRGKHLVQG